MAAVDHRICVVYGLARESDRVIRYIGQTVQPWKERLRQHIKHAKYSGGQTHRDNWIRKVLNDGDRVCLIVLEPNAVWNKTEVDVIARYSESGANLVNSTVGGEGCLNAPDELRRKISLAVTKNWQDAEIARKYSEAHRGVPWSQSRIDACYAVSAETRSERAARARRHQSKQRRREISRTAALASWRKKRANGTAYGVHCNSAKLDDARVREIRKLLSNGGSFSGIARNFGVTRECIAKIAHGKTWTHVA